MKRMKVTKKETKHLNLEQNFGGMKIIARLMDSICTKELKECNNFRINKIELDHKVLSKRSNKIMKTVI
jgi:hypothetical protein